MTTADLQNARPVHCVLDAQARLGECPRWDEKTQTLYWVDIKKGELHNFDPKTGQDTYVIFPEEIGCFSLRESGGFVAGLRSGLAFIDSFDDPTLIPIAAPEPHKPHNRFNDGRCDAKGRFWAGTINEQKSASDGTLYCLDTDLTVREITTGALTSNGVAFSPDNTILYYSDTPRHLLYGFDFDLEQGTASNKRLIKHFPDGQGRPDGAAVDAEGYYWSALFDGHSVVRMAPDGTIVESVDIPAQHCTMIALGGDDMKTAFVTTAREGMDEASLAQYPQAGGIFSFRVDVAGLIEPRFKG